MTSPPPNFDKIAMRSAMRRRRRTLSRHVVDAPQALAVNLALDKLPPFSVAAFYRPTATELDPGPLAEKLRAAGARIALPVVVDRRGPLQFREEGAAHLEVIDEAGMSSPPPDAEVLAPDVIFTPLLAFDRQGGRLGQGGGHYDRTLDKLRRQKKVFVIGLAYSGQEVKKVPYDAHDQRLDAILTESGYIEV